MSPLAGRGFWLMTVVSLLVAGCGGEPARTPTPTPATETATPTATEATTSPTPTPTPAHRARVITNDLNVRVGPGLDWPVLGILQDGDVIEVSGRNAQGDWLAITDTGWVFFDEEWIDLDEPVLALPVIAEQQVAGPMQPDGTLTGVAGVNRVINLVLAGDLDGLVEASETMMVRCATNPGGIGGPPRCPDGAADGTSIEVFPAGVCEGEHIAPSQLRDWWQRFVEGNEFERPGGGPLRLYAVFASDPAAGSDLFPVGEDLVIFGFEGGHGRVAWVEGEHVVRMSLACDGPAPYLARTAGTDVAPPLPPVPPPPLDSPYR